MRRDLTDPRREIEFRRRIKRGHEAPRDHVVNFRFRLIEVLRFRSRGDDGEVIADLRVVEDALVESHVIFLERLLSMRLQSAGQVVQRLSNDRQIVFGQSAGIRARVSEHFVSLVKRLRDL